MVDVPNDIEPLVAITWLSRLSSDRGNISRISGSHYAGQLNCTDNISSHPIRYVGYRKMVDLPKDIHHLAAITWLAEDRGNISRISISPCAGKLNFTNKTSNLSSHSINYMGYSNLNVPKDIEPLAAITWLSKDRDNTSRISSSPCAGKLNCTNKTSILSSHPISYVGYSNTLNVPKDIEPILAITWLSEDRGNMSRISGDHCAG